MSAARPLAPEWDALWTSYIQARREQDEQRIRELEAAMHRWHVRHGFPIPDWLDGADRLPRRVVTHA